MSWRVRSALEKPKGRLAVIGLNALSGLAGRVLQADFAAGPPAEGAQGAEFRLLPTRKMAA